MTQAYESFATHRAAIKLRLLSDPDLTNEIANTQSLVSLWENVPKKSRANYYQRKLDYLLELKEGRGQ